MMNTAINYHDRSTTQAYAKPRLAVETRPQETLTSRVTEVIVPKTSNSDNIVLPLVASMTKQKVDAVQKDGVNEGMLQVKSEERWVTWITDRKPSYQQLKKFGASARALRIIHVEKNDDNRWIIWDALNTGNSHTVIADIHILSKEDVVLMETAAINGQCTGTLVRSH